jgi:hypothetical protein
VAAVGTEVVRAQDDLGDSIASTVSNAVSGVATNSGNSVSGGTSSGGTASGGTTVQHNELSLGEQEGVAISDASGGNNNVSFVS